MMRKITAVILFITVVTALALAGCGVNSKVADGVNKMLDTTKELAQAIDSGDQAKVKKIGPALEDQWSSFEDQVKEENKPLYDKVEKYLDPVISGTQAPDLDKEALGKLNHQLSDALKELADSLK